MNPRTAPAVMAGLLSGVVVSVLDDSAAIAVAARLLSQLGATVTSDASNVAGAKIVLTRKGDAIDPGGHRIVACVDPGRDDLLEQAAAGICAGIGEPGRAPLKLPLDQSARQGGLTLAIAACAALRAQAAQRIDVSVSDVWAAFYSGPDVANARFGRARTRRGGHRTFGVPWPRTIMPCKDGYFAVQCATREHWQKFLQLTGKPEFESSPVFADRIKTNDIHGNEAEALFADWFSARTKDELAHAFLAAKIPGAPVYAIDEVAHHEHLAERRAFGAGYRPNLPYALLESRRTSLKAYPSCTPAAPLTGIRVVDFGWVWAGALPGAILSDLGAEVIKIETTTRLDYMRQGRPLVGTQRDPEQNPMFAAVNRGKRSFRVDMTQPEGASLLRELIASSDVVIENFSPGVLDRYQLGWKTVSSLSGGVVMCSMSAAGATGPFRDIRTYATMIAGLCGLDSMVGYPGERVIGSQSSYCDPNASLHATLAILAALYQRHQTGAGCWIDLSQWEAGLHTVEEALQRYAADGIVQRANGLARSDRLVHGCFPTATEDRWIAISVRDEEDLAILATALDAQDLTATNVAEVTARYELSALVERAPRQFAAPVRVAQEIADPELFEEVEHTVLGPVPVYRLPWKIDGGRLPIRSRAPLLGEHNPYVLQDILELTDERVAELEATGVLT